MDKNFIRFKDSAKCFAMSIFVFIAFACSVNAQGTCATAVPLCADGATVFDGTGGATDASTAETGLNLGCLGSGPSPSWFYIEVATAGDMDLALTPDPAGSVDYDFALYGPFADVAAATAACGAGLGAPVDCSFAGGTAPETPSLGTNASGSTATPQVGEVYMLLVSKFGSAAANFTLNQTGGGGATNCSILGGGAGCGCTNCPQALPDGANEDFFVNVNNAGAADCDLATNPLTSVTLDIDHTYKGDLTITLTSPSGQTVTLVGPTGTSGVLGGAYVFLPTSSGATQWNNSVAGDVAPGNFTPHIGDIAGFTGNVCGTWTINVADNLAVDTGNFSDFQLGFANDTDLSCTSDVPCMPVWDGTSAGGWDPTSCGYGASISLSVDYGSFVDPGPCVVAGAVDITSTWYLHAMATTDGVLATYDPCAGEGIASTANQSFQDFYNSLPANTTCDLQWYTVIPRLETSSSDATCQCNGTCHAYQVAAVNVPVYPNYGGLTAELVYTPGSCAGDTYTPSTFVVTPGSACDGSVVDASVMAADPGCGNAVGDDQIGLALAIDPAGLPAGCSAAAVYSATISPGVTCACGPGACDAAYAYSVADICSGEAPTFTESSGACVEPANAPSSTTPHLDLDWYIYAPGGVPGEAPAGYDPYASGAAIDAYPLADPNLIADGGLGGTWNGIVCADLTPSNALTNTTCAPITVTYFMLAWDRLFDTDGDGNFGEYTSTSCVEARYDVVVYPAPLSVAVTDDGSTCGTPTAELRDAAGNVCSTQAGPACGAIGDTFDYDFSADAVITALASAPAACIPANLTGTITCAGCAPGCEANNGMWNTSPPPPPAAPNNN